MAVIYPGKGCKVQIDTGTAYTDVPNVISIDLPEANNETFEADTLDNPDHGIPYLSTHRVEGGTLSFELFYDPGDPTQALIIDRLEDPDNATSGLPVGMKVVFNDNPTTPSTWDVEVAGFTLGGSIVLNDGIKVRVTAKVNKTPAWP